MSLQGSIGVRIDYDSTTSDQSGGYALTRTSFAFGTSVYDNPWNIFTSNVAALYYF